MNSLDAIGELRLSNFADASTSRGRVTKGVSSTPAAKADKDWWELQDEDLDDIRVKIEEKRAKSKKRRSSNKGKTSDGLGLGATFSAGFDGSIYYDLWHLLADYIPPADVGRFAAICSVTLRITRKSSFWKKLYKRHYVHVTDMPSILNSLNVTSHLYGLKCRVIQSLFYVYPPFKLRVTTPPGVSLSRLDMDKLSQSRVVSVWVNNRNGSQGSPSPFNQEYQEQQQGNNPPLPPPPPAPSSATSASSDCNFYFQFQTFEVDSRRRRRMMGGREGNDEEGSEGDNFGTQNQKEWKEDLLFGLAGGGSGLDYRDNINANLQEGSFILRVTSSRFMQIPINLTGWQLVEIGFPLAPDLKSHSIKLTFHSHSGWARDGSGGRNPMGKVGSVLIGGVTCVHLLPWWHPAYPLPLLHP